MSFKLFFLSTFGRIKGTSKIEAEQKKLWADYQEFIAVEGSDELKKFQELKDFVQSDAFAQTKKEINNLTFKGSKEEKQLKEYQKLHHQKKLKKYYLTAGSAELKKYENFKESTTLKRYLELVSFIKDGQFKTEKEKYKKEVFKGSPEEKKLKEFKRLEKNKKLKHFLLVKDSSELAEFESFTESETIETYIELQKKKASGKLSVDEKQKFKELKSSQELVRHEKFKKSTAYRNYLEISKSSLPKQFEDLKEEINSVGFKERQAYLEDKNKFEKTEAFSMFQEHEKLKGSADIRFFIKYPKSSDYKNYKLVEGSAIKKRYEELKEIVESNEFLARKAYLEDDKKWEKTDEFQKEENYAKMKNQSHILNYIKYKDSNSFDFFQSWDLVFEDRFETNKLDIEKWQTVSPWASKTVGRNFSQIGDLHGFTSNGENVKLKDGQLQITVNKEKNKSLVWQVPFGFQEEELDYSSGLLSTGNLFQPKYGIIEAKILFAPHKKLVDVFYLAGADQTSRVNLLESGTVNRVGINLNESGKALYKGTSLTGIPTKKYYIFRLEWEQDKLTWKINGKEIYSTNVDVPNEPMHINLASLVIDKPEKLPHHFMVDWVRFYQKKS